ncbi:MAG: hypothetical protein ACREJB_01830 [Planctomycetaceae bacterium]
MMPSCRSFLTACAALTVLAVLTVSNLPAQEADSPEAPDSQVVLEGLDNPSGLAIQPSTGHLFVAEHRGVYRYAPGSKQPATLEIGSYPTDIYGKGPMYDIGPLGLGFMENGNLVVGDGSRKDSQELIRVYKMGDEPADEPQPESSALHTLGPIPAGDVSVMGEGNFFSVAIGAGMILSSSNGDDTKGWIVAAPIGENGEPGKLDGYIATKVATGVDAPVPIIFSQDGADLIVGQMGEVNIPGDSLLTIYDPKSKELKLEAEIGLHDVCGLAVSPKTGKLYCTDFGWVKPEDGGLFRLDIEGETVKAAKIMSLDKPTVITFDKEGGLYVAVFGTAEEGSNKLPGKILRIEPGL